MGPKLLPLLLLTAAAVLRCGDARPKASVNFDIDLVRLGEHLANAFSDRDTYRRRSDDYLFYEGNYCSQNLAGSFWDDDRSIRIDKKESFLENDEARSMLIQGPLRAGNIVWVCDHPSRCNRDDRTRIYVKSAIPSGKGYCVHSFEKSYEDRYVKVEHRHKNGLDGKVSQVKNYD